MPVRGGSIVALTTLAVLAACERGPVSHPEDLQGAKWDVDGVDALERHPDPYFAALHTKFVELARAERAEFDWVDTAYFVALARTAARGEPTAPVHPDERNIDPAMAELLAIPHTELSVFVASDGGRLRAGELLAEAHAAFECWVQELEEGTPNGDAEACQQRFEDVMPTVRLLAPLPGDLAVVTSPGRGIQIDKTDGTASRTLDRPFAAGSTADAGDVPVTEGEIRQAFGDALGAAPPPPKLFVATFGFNDTALDADDMATVAAAVDEAVSRPHAEIVITGHADAPGSRRDNLAVSAQRARLVRQAVLDALAERGVDENKVTVPGARGIGARQLAEDVPVKEERNRRVELLVR